MSDSTTHKEGSNVKVMVESSSGADDTAWHALKTVDEVYSKLSTALDSGLTSSEAQARLQQYGPNRMTPPKKAGFFERLWNQVSNILMAVLFSAAVVAAALKDWAEVGLILGVIICNVAIGMIQEGRAEKAADAIKAMLSSSANVIRDSERKKVDAGDLVPGDIVVLKSGDKVPADMRLVELSNLQVQEAMLTGESLPVSKNLVAVDPTAGLGDRKCMAYSATTVMSGQARAVVVATGDLAEIGKISKMVATVDDVKTDLLVQMELLGNYISCAVLVISIVALLLSKLRHGDGWGYAFKTAVAIAVAIIPEGLPAVVTITLALGTTNMARNKAIIRQLPAVETLGSLTVICSDKTGTLTKNEMTAVALRTTSSVFKITGVGYSPEGKVTSASDGDLAAGDKPAVMAILEGGILCNDSALTQVKDVTGKLAYAPQGAPTEVALITAAMKAGIDPAALKQAKPRVASVPFESEHKFMATVHQDAGQRVMYVKGAPDRLMPVCATQMEGNDISCSGPFDGQFWTKAQAELSSKGLRVIAVCRAVLDAKEDLSLLSPTAILKRPPFLTMVAMTAILDPPREEAVRAAEVAHKAGITVKMITGDHALTALAIGRILNITGDGTVLTGPEVDAMSDEQLERSVLGCNIYARASPENKLRIVRALQARRQVAAMTGDGVNDAPALKAANIGVAMGITGTDVSKEAAKMVLADDNFATIVAAVHEGRRVWDNLYKIVLFNLPVNAAQGLSILFAYIIGMDDSPLTAMQVLYVNLITSVTMGLMLAAEPPEPSVMERPPRLPGVKLVGRLVLWRCFYATTVIVVLVLGMFRWGRTLDLTMKERRAEAFNVLVFAEIGYCITTRFISQSTLHPRIFTGNKWCYISIAITVALQLFLTYTPGVQDVFSCASIGSLAWARIMVCMFVTYAVVELEKLLAKPVLTRLNKLQRSFSMTLDNRVQVVPRGSQLGGKIVVAESSAALPNP